jgi:hypothetical protein
MFEEFKHRHKWAYMFSAGDGNTYNWFYCTECLTQCVASLDNSSGKVGIEYFEIKPPEKRRR